MNILIVNGPNLNLLGRRDPAHYGTATMEEILEALRAEYPDDDIDYYQSNHEGDLIDRLHEAGYDPAAECDGIVLNAGGYTHTSVALADAVEAIGLPVIEVHLSRVAAREPERRVSLLGAVCRGSIAGLGPAVYTLAVDALHRLR